jgi:hypothetical protein
MPLMLIFSSSYKTNTFAESFWDTTITYHHYQSCSLNMAMFVSEKESLPTSFEPDNAVKRYMPNVSHMTCRDKQIMKPSAMLIHSWSCTWVYHSWWL